ncbi:hypothetical protein Hdeb2414_s0144g00812691 [Helianthus debilis subsp. tardiflorus]
MFYKLISDGGWFTFAKRKDNTSQPFYSFMPTSTYPKEWKSRFIFVSAAMIPESPPLRDSKAVIEDSIPILFADETVQWKRMYENHTRAFTFPEGILGRKETPLYNSKAKKRLSKLDKEFGGKDPALLEKILERPMMSIDELKALLTPSGPSSPKSLSGDDSQ